MLLLCNTPHTILVQVKGNYSLVVGCCSQLVCSSNLPSVNQVGNPFLEILSEHYSARHAPYNLLTDITGAKGPALHQN